VNKGGQWETPVPTEETSPTKARILSAVLVLELLWLMLLAASVVFLAVHLSGDTADFPADPIARRVVLVAVPPMAVIVGLALISARQAVDRRMVAPSVPLDSLHRGALLLTAAANVAVVVSIVTSLYHAHATWVVVGLGMTAGLIVVAVACVRAARQ
jgi:hypothetical protein